MWDSINLPVSSAIGQLHKTTSFCGPELFDNSKVGMSPLSWKACGKFFMAGKSSGVSPWGLPVSLSSSLLN